jgi:hypothetical protein
MAATLEDCTSEQLTIIRRKPEGASEIKPQYKNVRQFGISSVKNCDNML